jgi:Rad52/22 family double-strand break repair protein
MQETNGVETSHQECAPQEPSSLSAVARKALPADLLMKLKVPLPVEAVSPNQDKPGLSVIKVIYVVERLNEVFGLNGWHVVNQVVESGRMVVVKATVTIPEYGIEIEQYGGNDNPDRGDAYKGACTDALSKCASYLGVGMDVYKGLRDERLKNGTNGLNRNGAGTHRPIETGRETMRQNGDGRAAPTGLTTKNMVECFAALRTIIGTKDYDAILKAQGYRDVTSIPTLEKSRDVYRALLDAFRCRYRESRQQLGEAEYAKILRELRLSPKAKLSPDQAVRVFNHMAETLYAKQ